MSSLLDLTQVSPSEWGAKIDYDSWAPGPDTNQVFIHWLGTPATKACAAGKVKSEISALLGAEKYHVKTKKWDGLAYDWAIGNSGTLYRVRGLGRSAATSGDVDGDGTSNNAEGEAIVLLIGEGQDPSEAALATLREVLDTKGAIQVFAHREAKGTKTACPGDFLTVWVNKYRTGNLEAKAPAAPAKTRDKYGSIEGLPTLKPKASGPHVLKLQRLLETEGHQLYAYDGKYGPRTQQALVGFQRQCGLVADSIVGPKTWGALLNAPGE